LHGLYWKLYKLQYADPSRAQIAEPEEEEEEQVSYRAVRRMQFSE